jgi:hypothetical protein
VVADVDAATWTARALEPEDRALLVAVVLEEHRELRRVALVHSDVLDEPLLLQDQRDAVLDLGEGDLGAIQTRQAGVPDTGEHVGNGIRHHGSITSTSSTW